MTFLSWRTKSLWRRRYVIMGHVCPYGAQCTFAHDELELHRDRYVAWMMFWISFWDRVQLRLVEQLCRCDPAALVPAVLVLRTVVVPETQFIDSVNGHPCFATETVRITGRSRMWSSGVARTKESLPWVMAQTVT